MGKELKFPKAENGVLRLNRAGHLAARSAVDAIAHFQVGQRFMSADVDALNPDLGQSCRKKWMRGLVHSGLVAVVGGKFVPGGWTPVYERQAVRVEYYNEPVRRPARKVLKKISPQQRRIADKHQPGTQLQTDVALVNVWGPHTVPVWQIRGTVEHLPSWGDA